MLRTIFPRRYFSTADILLVFVFAAVIYGFIGFGKEWRAEFNPVMQIDLSLWSLPKYAFFSACRGFAAYGLSLTFTLIVGYVAARSRLAEQIILPLLDVLQSIPVLGFLPGLVLALIALFPHTNVGLELAAIIMIFTGQVWNMTFSYYASLKAIPKDLTEASTIIGLSRLDCFKRIEIPFAAVNLAWNSLLSMAGGWFFLTVCEAFTLGEHRYRLPGIGAYMAVAIEQGNIQAMIYGIVSMILLILMIDLLVWRPILVWIQRFRVEEVAGPSPHQTSEPLMHFLIRESRILPILRAVYSRTIRRFIRTIKLGRKFYLKSERAAIRSKHFKTFIENKRYFLFISKILGVFIFIFCTLLFLYGTAKLAQVLFNVSGDTWVLIFRNTAFTLLRVFGAIVLGSLWAIPVGVWIGLSSKRIQIAQPIIQILASFPAPMVYPLLVSLFFKLGVGLNYSSMFLLLLGVQWYILFNVLAGTLRIPQELKYALALMKTPRWERWKKLYLPSVFPTLVSGWLTAAGGAWNASIVAEYMIFNGELITANGLGATISLATGKEDFSLLAASLTVMVALVIILNRTFWAKIYEISQSRFRLDV